MEPALIEGDDNIVLNTMKKRNDFKWTTYKRYDQFDEASEFLESEGFVSYDYFDLKIGQKFYFRCKKNPESSEALL